MTEPGDHRALVRQLLDFGQEAYANGGGVAPMVHVIGDPGSVVAVPDEPAVVVADWMPAVVFGLTAVLRAGLAGFVAEAWHRLAQPGDPEPRRGDLERREAEGDPEVTTVLLAGAVSRVGLEFSMRQLLVQDDGTLRWEPVVTDGRTVDGALVDGLRNSYRLGLDAEPPPTLEEAGLARALGMVLTLTGSEGTVSLR